MSKAPTQLETISSLLRQQSALSLATVDEHGQPCIAPLNYIVDSDLTLYWLSAENSAHSMNLERNPVAAVTVYRPAEYWRDICGVQMHGQVARIIDPHARRLLVKRYRERFKLGAVFGLAISRCALYAFRPEFIRYIDNSRRLGFRFELDLAAEKAGREPF